MLSCLDPFSLRQVALSSHRVWKRLSQIKRWSDFIHLIRHCWSPLRQKLMLAGYSVCLRPNSRAYFELWNHPTDDALIHCCLLMRWQSHSLSFTQLFYLCRKKWRSGRCFRVRRRWQKLWLWFDNKFLRNFISLFSLGLTALLLTLFVTVQIIKDVQYLWRHKRLNFGNGFDLRLELSFTRCYLSQLPSSSWKS